MPSWLGILLAWFIFGANASPQTTTQVTGDHDQTAGLNRGVMIQNNITVNKSVEKNLRRRARTDFGSEQGWLRVLTPAVDSIPQGLSCPTKKMSLTVILGGGLVSSCDRNLCKVLADNSPNAESRDLLSVENRGTSLAINALIFDDSGKVVAALNGNHPHINKNNAFDWKRPDDHTLDVVDQKNRTVLHVRFLNPTAVYFEGIFFDAGGTKLSVTKENLTLSMPHAKVPFSILTGSCSDNDGVSFAF
jgi:hypothetical protein